MSSSELKGVLIVAGYFAGFQAEAWRRIPGVKMVAVADALFFKAGQFVAPWQLPKTYAQA